MAIAQLLPSGILSFLVAGSAAWGEAVEVSDIDFNAYVTDSYRDTPRTRSMKATTPHILLVGFERDFRKQVEDAVRSVVVG